ncbi:MAG TPA: hypothetical protein VII06_37160 [Chloroflexota bacterium]|jgi:hypothetical protein
MPRLAVLAAAAPAFARRLLAFRQGRADDPPHSSEAGAERIGIDSSFARTLDEYLQARRRLRLDRSGWRAGFHRLG